MRFWEIRELTASVGSRAAQRDPHAQRILDSIAAGTGQWVTTPAEVGGYSPMATAQRTFDMPVDPAGDSDGNGYTNIEELLFQMATAVEHN